MVANKLEFLGAAERVLAEASEPFHCGEIARPVSGARHG